MEETQIVWLKSEIKTPPFSFKARIKAGVLLRKIQFGEILTMPVSKSMPDIGNNCSELRIHDSETKIDWRIVYHICDFAVVILDVFEKKTNKTPKIVITKCQRRLKMFYENI